MPSSRLIVTKLRGPTDTGQWVARERLLTGLVDRHRGRRCRACVISAAGGFGKTTLAAQWGDRLSRAGDAVSWLTLDQDDDNAERLCEYILAAAHRSQPAVDGELASLLRGRALDAPSRVLTEVINAIAAAKKRMTLILDDCQHLSDPRTRELLRFLVVQSPDNLHLVLTMRPPSPLPLGTLRAHDEITEIDAAALRFDTGESDVLLNRLGRLELGADSVQKLCDRTEGWPAALRLVSLSLHGRSDRSAAGKVILGFSGGTRAVADYLAENVLDRLDARWSRFLLKTAVLDRLCAEVCEAVTGEAGSQDLLVRTEEAGLFLIGLDGERRWFRYHHLFADFLRRRLAASPELSARDLHLAASEWFAGQGLIEEAVGHALSAGAPERALALIERDARLLVEQSRMTVLLGLVDRLHPSLVAGREALQIAVAWAKCLLHATDDSEAIVAALTPEDPALAAELDLIRATNAGFQADLERVETLLERALPRLPSDPWLLGVAANLAAFVHLSHGRAAAAREAVRKGRPHQDRGRGTFTAVYGRCFEGLALAQMGDLDGASRCYERGMEVALREVGRHGYATRMVSGYLGELRYEKGDLAAASELLEAGFSLRDQGNLLMDLAVYPAQARVREALGDHDGALAVLYEGARHAAAQRLDALAAAVMHEEMRIHLAAGNVELAARRCAAAAAPPPHERPQARELRQLARARLSLAEGRAAPARDMLAPLLEAAVHDGRRRVELSVRLVAALAAHATGDAEAARAQLAACLALGAIRSFVDEGSALHRLLRRLPPAGSSSHLARVLAAFGPAGPVAPAVGGQRSALIEPLNVRELQILRLVEEGMVNKDISTALSIGLDTVKWHLKNAYKKLGVATRTGAIHAARAAGVLGAKGAPGPRLAAPARHHPNR